MNRELISVVVPCYNAEKYIAECVCSLLKQDYPNFELIIVDDGSNDNTGALLDELAKSDSRMKVYHKENSGAAGARNYGVEKSSGVYLSFVDADDYVDARYLSTLYSVLKENDAEMAGCYLERIETEKREETLPPKEHELFLFERPEDFMIKCYSDFEFGDSQLVSVDKLTRRELYLRHPFISRAITEDAWNTPYVVFECKRIAVTNEKLYYYRQHDESAMHKDIIRNTWIQFELWEMHIDFCRKKGDAKLLTKVEQFVCHHIYANRMFFSKENREIVRAKYSEIIREMIWSKYLPLKAKIKYITFAHPSRLWKRL